MQFRQQLSVLHVNLTRDGFATFHKHLLCFAMWPGEVGVLIAPAVRNTSISSWTSGNSFLLKSIVDGANYDGDGSLVTECSIEISVACRTCLFKWLAGRAGEVTYNGCVQLSGW